MPVTDWFIVTSLITLFFLISSYTIFTFINFSDVLFSMKIQKQINKSLINIFQTYLDDSNYEQSLYEIKLIMQKLTPKSTLISKKYDTLLALIEYFLVDINCGKIEDKDNLKKRVFNFITIYKKRNPLDEISGSNYSVLKELLENDDSDKQFEFVTQLAIELKKKEDQIDFLHISNKKSSIYSIIGIIVSFVFGVISTILAL